MIILHIIRPINTKNYFNYDWGGPGENQKKGRKVEGESKRARERGKEEEGSCQVKRKI